ncbi:MAG: peptidoglycan DD-metalloendopeptidase family protein [Clostridia bacterium]|nr:peptidoglycan DD-metalloendopeptidase family protein [Clostridia bacterium]
MKYTTTSRFPRFVGGMGFYAIIALCLLGLGAASWFAVSRYNKMENSTTPQSSINEYSGPQSSYNSSTDTPEDITTPSAEETEKTVSDVPYSEPQESAPAPQKTEKRSFVLPLDGNIQKGYSDTALQYSATIGDMRLHLGIDICAAENTDIKAVGSGNITAVEDSATLGKTVVIDHGDKLTVKYCGMASVNVKVGDKVQSGTVIGTLGTVPLECADKSHLHLEATLDGKSVSPLAALGLE